MKLTLSRPAISRREKLWPGASAPERIDRRSSAVTSSVTDRDSMGRTVGADRGATSCLALQPGRTSASADINYSGHLTGRCGTKHPMSRFTSNPNLVVITYIC